jgi:hypothetical protein
MPSYYDQGYAEPEESIYDLIPVEQRVHHKSKQYKSKYPPTIAPTASTFGSSTTSACMTTNMGGKFTEKARSHAHVRKAANWGPQSWSKQKSDPKRFVKKSEASHLTKKVAIQPFRYPDRRMPPVDCKNKVKKSATSRNFIVENALAAITSKPGNTRKEQTDFRSRPGYAKAPEYLTTIKAQVASEREQVAFAMQTEKERERRSKPQVRLLEEDARLALLDNLKTKWAQVNKVYQNMTHIVNLDTCGKIKRKEEAEQELQQLERSIQKLSKPNVYVHDDQ